jgi:hypothetical protein
VLLWEKGRQAGLVGGGVGDETMRFESVTAQSGLIHRFKVNDFIDVMARIV